MFGGLLAKYEDKIKCSFDVFFNSAETFLLCNNNPLPTQAEARSRHQ